MEKLNFIYNRRSVRKFTEVDIPLEDIREMIRAASYAPSGKNQQNWHFVIVRDKSLIAEMVRIVEEKNQYVAECMGNEEKKTGVRAMVHYHTVFRNAPCVVMAYAGPYVTVADDLTEAGLMPASDIACIQQVHPGLQNLAAAMENLLLAAANMGYGGCWMTGPMYAAKELSRLLNFHKEGYYLAAMTPLGVPAESHSGHPPRKPLEEIMTVIG